MYKYILTLLLLVSSLSLFFLNKQINAMENNQNVYEFSANLINGQKVKLSDYKNQVLLIVNTASECGNTPQYKGLEELYQKYKSKGFTVLAFPCNQFGEQEPGTSEEINNFCKENYNISFPLFEKVDVNGEKSHPLFQYLRKNTKGLLTKDIKWNFTKFLVGKDGVVIKRFSPKTKPETLTKDIEELL